MQKNSEVKILSLFFIAKKEVIMAFFGKFKAKKEEKEMTLDEKQEEKAKTDVEEKDEKSEQTAKDREDESVAGQEKEDGDENSESAKDREDESEGAEKTNEEKSEADSEDVPKWAMGLIEKLSSVIEMLAGEKSQQDGKEELPKPKELPNDEEDEESEEDNSFFKD